MEKVMVIISSTGRVEPDIDYARRCLQHVVSTGESPARVFSAGDILRESENCHRAAVYEDKGINDETQQLIDLLEKIGTTVEYRSINKTDGAHHH